MKPSPATRGLFACRTSGLQRRGHEGLGRIRESKMGLRPSRPWGFVGLDSRAFSKNIGDPCELLEQSCTAPYVRWWVARGRQRGPATIGVLPWIQPCQTWGSSPCSTKHDDLPLGDKLRLT